LKFWIASKGLCKAKARTVDLQTLQANDRDTCRGFVCNEALDALTTVMYKNRRAQFQSNEPNEVVEI
jgi:hypothetical protein